MSKDHDDDLSLASRLGWEQLVEYHRYHGFNIAVAQTITPDAAKPWLLLLHGFPSSGWDWYRLWPTLSERYNLLAPDFLGFGLSDKPVDHHYSLLEQADICLSLLAAHDVTELHLISHDYGDSVAQELLSRQDEAALPVKVLSCAMLNGGILPSHHRPLRIQKLLAGPLGPMLNHLLTKDRFKQSFSAVFGRQTKPVDAELNMIWDFIIERNGHRISHKLLQYMAERKAHETRWVRTVLAPPCPLSLIFGADDPISGAHVISAYQDQGGEAQISVLDGIGHYPQMEAPERVLEALNAFFP